MKNDISKIIIMAILVEGIITYINEFFVNNLTPWQLVLSLILGIFVSLVYKLDLLKCLHVESEVPYVGSVLTGILISRGSNYLYDLVSKLDSLK